MEELNQQPTKQSSEQPQPNGINYEKVLNNKRWFKNFNKIYLISSVVLSYFLGMFIFSGEEFEGMFVILFSLFGFMLLYFLIRIIITFLFKNK